MADDVKKEEGTSREKVEGKPEDKSASEIQELKAKLEAAEKKVGEITSAKAQLETRLGKVEGKLKDHYRRSVLSGLVDEDLYQLAPAVEIDEDGDITGTSASALSEWRKKKAALFQSATTDSKSGTQTLPKVPPAGGTSNQLTWEYWEKLKQDNYAEYAARQAEYINWARTQNNR